MGNLATSALNNFTHGFYPLVLTVLNIWTFVYLRFVSDFEIRFSYFFKIRISINR